MSLSELLTELSRQEIKLWSKENNQLGIRAPKGTLTPELRNTISEHKQEILELLEQKSFVDTLPQISPSLHDLFTPFPLTDMQQAYLVGRSNSFENIAIHGYLEIECSNLNIDSFCYALNKLIQRHDMLRAVVTTDGKQQIQESIPEYKVQQENFNALTEEEQTTRLKAIRSELSHQVLPLEKSPPFEFRVSHLKNGQTILHVSVDCTFVDHWSMQTLFRELIQLYENINTPLIPEKIGVSFRDYVLGLLEVQKTKTYQNSLNYWKKRITDLPSAPELPKASLIQNHKKQFTRRTAKLQPQVWQKLKAMSRSMGITPVGILFAAYAEVLALWSKSSHFTINVPIFNRLPLHEHVNYVLGNFSSFVPTEVHISTTESFKVRAQKLEAQKQQDMEHQYVSGVRILREIYAAQGMISDAAFPIVFTSNPSGIEGLNTDESFAFEKLGKIVYAVNQTPQVWLDNQVSYIDDGVTFNWDAMDGLFPEGMIDDMLRAYCFLLEKLATDEKTWETKFFDLRSPQQIEQHLQSNTKATNISQQPLLHRFVDQVRNNPQQVAVICSNIEITYQQLYNAVHHLSEKLRNENIRVHHPIAIVMEKGWQQVVAAISTWAVGCPYMPIDASLPQERISYLLENGNIDVVLTQEHLLEKIKRSKDIKHFTIAAESLQTTVDIVNFNENSELAYIIYTSGSTGTPNGVMIRHEGLANAVYYTNEHFKVQKDDRTLALTGLHHDMSLYDIFGMLSAGGTIVMPSHLHLLDPEHWWELIDKHHITIWNSVPALMEILLEYLHNKKEMLLPSLRLTFLGGDWIPTNLPHTLQKFAPKGKVVSVGGPTETTLWNIWYEINHVDSLWQSIPYGKPIANAKYYILNQNLQDCPYWVPGDLCCAGMGLTKGYWNNEEKTQTKFITHPLSGEKLYVTGDLGRYLPDGNIEFLGRSDSQIKIRGYRIEPGEIEATLHQHPSVQKSVVVAFEENGKKDLVAYVVKKVATNSNSNSNSNIAEKLEFKLGQQGLRTFANEDNQVELPGLKMNSKLRSAYLKRQSYREFVQENIDIQDFGEFLSCLRQTKIDDIPLPKYLYPSGGCLYPVQTYVHIKTNRIKGLAQGNYYYHPQKNTLIPTSNKQNFAVETHLQSLFDRSAFSLFLIADMRAIEPIYGDFSRDLCFLEAGYMGQLLMQTAPEYLIGLCPVGYKYTDDLQEMFQLGESHILVHALVGGKLEPARLQKWLPFEEAKTASGSLPSVSVSDLQNYLSEKLPTQMIPNRYIFLDAFPLTANGKIDRKNLPSPAAQAYKPKSTDNVQNNTEQILLRAFQEVVVLPDLDIHNNFFEMGANSIDLVRFHTKIKECLSKDIVLTDIFKHPTIHSLAEFLDIKTTNVSFTQVNDRAAKQKQSLLKRKNRKR